MLVNHKSPDQCNSSYGISLLTTKEAAALLGVSTAFLERDRVHKATRNIPFVKLGGKIVKYRLQDLMLYLEQNLQAATQQ